MIIVVVSFQWCRNQADATRKFNKRQRSVRLKPAKLQKGEDTETASSDIAKARSGHHESNRLIEALRENSLSGGVGGPYDPEQVDVEASYNAGEAGNGTFVRHKTEQDFFHPGKLLVNHFEAC